MSWIDTVLMPLKVVVAWIMVRFHDLFVVLGIPGETGLAWALSIVGLVIVMRIVLIPLFVKQIKASRGMQLIAPDLQKIQKKYKGKSDPASREAMSRETMELYRKHGTNPFASCLPILAQSPIFFALFRVLYNMPRLAMDPDEENAYPRDQIGPLTRDLADEFTEATLFGARLSDWFLASDEMSVKIVAAVLIVAMSATTFFTQKQLTQKNMPATALQGPMAQQQKLLLYLLPFIFLVTGVNFPIGVLIYWTTTNLWSMGQQFYVIRRNPTPGSEAERALKERRARKAAAKGIVLEEDKPAPAPEKPRGQRQQPKRKDRAKGATPAGSPTDETGPAPAGDPDAGGGTDRAAGGDKPSGGGAQQGGSGGPKPTAGAKKKRKGKGSSGPTR
ncbi:membrane protein insertase YidC [Cellulomonas bogoriensis]|uniref:Membrane protein insertase YidC n=1 Tax=Cellulomonas bogoriensis 69B4 = DSM 16987 TaxID=1386082 RepID=A0A0A0BY36_9CELL|nr:membrane protein insertase YidC [Cellulomonas bogoriensis]KGM13283.1 preprotein translocase subunit YidC [Cellulomonas bogoriensis 69B4 = DSM 16987]